MRAVLILATLLGVAHADETTTFARHLLDELVAIDTSNPPGNEEKAAKFIATKLRAAGIEPVIVPFAPGRANVIARLRGDGSKRPLVLLAHLDVVGAAGQPWTMPPFTVTEKDGWMYGRGVSDDKSWAAMATAIVIELKRQKAPLHRDIILALTGDEESGGAGIRYVLDHRKELLGDAEYALNEGGGVLLDAAGKPRLVSLGTAEKTFQDFSFTAHGVGGHSSVPNDENAIYRLARALDKLSAYKFPTRLSPAVRDSLRATAVTQPAERARAMRAAADVKGDAIPPDLLAIMDAHPLVRALTRTTCVATMMTGGTRDNALPVTAQATVNCRIMPVDTIDFVRDTLEKLAGGLADVAIIPDVGVGPEVANSGPVRAAVEKATRAVYGPDVPVVARIGLGASDSRFLRRVGIKSYGIGVLAKPDELVRNAHGPDEGAPAASFPLGVRFLREIVRNLAL
jgi:acetylornithine deacetylase/succinyl-diaminopimelate desuccinylase-like protein